MKSVFIIILRNYTLLINITQIDNTQELIDYVYNLTIVDGPNMGDNK